MYSRVYFNMYVGFFYFECRLFLFNDIIFDIFYDLM